MWLLCELRSMRLALTGRHAAADGKSTLVRRCVSDLVYVIRAVAKMILDGLLVLLGDLERS